MAYCVLLKQDVKKWGKKFHEDYRMPNADFYERIEKTPPISISQAFLPLGSTAFCLGTPKISESKAGVITTELNGCCFPEGVDFLPQRFMSYLCRFGKFWDPNGANYWFLITNVIPQNIYGQKKKLLYTANTEITQYHVGCLSGLHCRL